MYYYRVYDDEKKVCGYSESEEMIIKDNYEPMFESDYLAMIEAFAAMNQTDEIAELKTRLAELEANNE